MIVTVKLSNLNYKTLAIDIGTKYIETDKEYLDHIMKLIRLELWEGFDSHERRKYRNDINNFVDFPIVMMYSRNRDNFTD